MKRFAHIVPLLALSAVFFASSGCTHAPGYPRLGEEIGRPDQQLDFHVLFKENCSGCHGDNGRGGAAIPLNNPAYLVVAGADNLRSIISRGMPATLMPPFAASSGGMLTDSQVDAMVHGMLREWARPADYAGAALPPYATTAPGNATNGQSAYTAACARCHGSDGAGIQTTSQTNSQPVLTPHSIVDPTYLSLVNDQNLRSYVIGGHLDFNAPDWRSYIPGRALTPLEITDIVAWIASHRAPNAEQSTLSPRINPPGVAAEKEKP
jgi:mono/diheme cytochrome c family protein